MNLNELSSNDIRQILKIRRKIEALERRLGDIVREAQKRPPAKPDLLLRGLSLPRKVQPSLRTLISAVLAKAGRPLSVPEIYEATLATGYTWRSQEPINALNVKMYTDRTFKKCQPGLFILRRQPSSTK